MSLGPALERRIFRRVEPFEGEFAGSIRLMVATQKPSNSRFLFQ